MISLSYDIIAQWYHSQYLWYPYWYHVWYHIWYHGPASMISRLYAILSLWYQSTYHKLSCSISEKSSMIAYVMTRWLYPPPKSQVQVQDVRNWRLWFSALLDEARLVLVVKCFLMLANATWAFSCKLMQQAAWQDNLLSWCCMQGRHSWSWTRCLQEFRNQLGTLTRYRVTQQLESNCTYTVGAPTDCEWIRETEGTKLFAILAHQAIWRTFAGFWSTVVSPFACDSWFSNRSYRTSRSKLPASQQQWSGLELRKGKMKGTNQFKLLQLHNMEDT